MANSGKIGERMVRWMLRVSAWLIVAGSAIWIASDPARAALWGRVMQAHVRFEKRSAVETILQDACGPRISELPAGLRLPGWGPGSVPPVSFWFSSAELIDKTPYLVIGSEGTAAWPLLHNPPEPNAEWAAIPEVFVARGRDGANVLGAMTFRWGNTGEYEWRFWRHRGEQWEITGVLRARAPSGIGNFETRFRPRRDATETLSIGRPPMITLHWNRDTQRFDVPATLPAPFTRFEQPTSADAAP